METRASIILLELSRFALSIGSRELIERLLNLPKRLFHWVGVPDYLLPELSGPLVIFFALLALSLLLKPVRHFLKAVLRWLIRKTGKWSGLKVAEESSRIPASKERIYLKWLKAELSNISHQWHETPIIPTPAHTKKPLGRFVRYKARLFRHDPADYGQNPALTDAELSIRAGFGRRVRIKDLAKELRKFRKIVVLGDPGSGKSVCLRQLAYDLAESELTRDGRPRTLPIYVDMGAFDSWQDEAARKPTDVFTFLKTSLRTHPSASGSLEMHPLFYVSDNLETLLFEGRVTLIFDALDEMPQDSYQERYQVLKEFVVMWEAFENNRFIFSCRLLDYDPSFNLDEIVIDRFDKKRILAFLKRHAPQIADELYKRILDDDALEELVSNPFLLQALAYINVPYADVDPRARGLWIPTTRGELLREFVEQLLQREAGMKQKKHLESIQGGLPTLRRFLAKLAFVLQERREGRTSAQTTSLQEIWSAEPEWKRLLWIARRARILGKRGEPAHQLVDTNPPNIEPPDRIQFVHHRLQEIFAAEELANRLSNGEPVGRYLEDIWWQETVVFAVGMVPDPHSVVNRILSPQDEANAWVKDLIAYAKHSQPEEESVVAGVKEADQDA